LRTSDWKINKHIEFMMIGKKIIVARKSKGWSQKELAANIPIDQGHLAKLEGGRTPSSKTLRRIASALGLPIEYFLEAITAAQDEFDEVNFNKNLKQVSSMPLNRKKALNVVLEALLDLTSVQRTVE
jgi:transcriptional regulator with XRE-family HTH domain